MLHAAVSENKTQDRQGKTQSEPESERRASGWAGYPALGLGGENGATAGNQRAQGWQPINLSTLSQGGILQRKCAECQQEERPLQRKAAGSDAKTEIPSLFDEVLQSPGEPLDLNTREFMESRLENDFSHVRLHMDTKAAESARIVNASAYTVGSNIVFDPNCYKPQTSTGRHLIAHELVHVMQQARGPVSGQLMANGLRISQTGDPFERQADEIADRINTPNPVSLGKTLAQPSDFRISRVIQRQVSEANATPLTELDTPPVSWTRGLTFGSAIELPSAEAARRVNEAIDVMGSGLTYVRRPPASGEAVAAIEDKTQSSSEFPALQAFPDINIQRAVEDSSPLAKIHGGVVGSIQVCWDCLNGDASLKGWIWAGVGYDTPFGWLGGFYFGEKTWWRGDLGKWFDPGTCDAKCDSSKGSDSESGWGIAGFPLDIRPKQRASFSKGGIEGGFLLTPHSFCDGDIELIALLNILGYLGPIATVATKAIDGLNTLTRNRPHVTLEAGIDISATFHFCRGANSLLAVNRANFCGGGYVGAGFGLSHTKTENHGAI